MKCGVSPITHAMFHVKQTRHENYYQRVGLGTPILDTVTRGESVDTACHHSSHSLELIDRRRLRLTVLEAWT
jgi:hypothetical protein